MSNLQNIGPSLEEMDSLVDQIIERAYLNDLPAKDAAYLRETLSAQINRHLGVLIMENLSSEAQAEYAELIVDDFVPDPLKLQALLVKHVPDYQNKIKQGLQNFADKAVASLSK